MEKVSDVLKIDPVVIPEICPQCKKKLVDDKPYCLECDLFFGLETGKKVTKGKCLYCDYVGELSGEHIIPKWVAETYTSHNKKAYRKIVRPLKIDLWNVSDLHEKTENQKKPLGDLVVHNVCIDCNSGWMSDLQRQAKPLIIRLVNSEWPELTKTQCEILSRWSAMISLNLHSLNKSVNQNEINLAELKNGMMPSGWKVYIVRLEDIRHAGESFTVTGYVPIGVRDKPLSYNVTYFCVERVMFFTVSTIGNHLLSYIKYGGFDIDNIATTLNFRAIWPSKQSALKTKKNIFSEFDYMKLRNLLGR